MKQNKKVKQWHSSQDKTGSGDFYGTGVKQKMGRSRTNYLDDIIKPSKMKNVPKSLA